METQFDNGVIGSFCKYCKMLKVIANLTRPTSLKALTGFLSPGRNYCAAKDEGNSRVMAKPLSF